MRLRDWHDRELARNREYAAASAEPDLAEKLADLVLEARIRVGLSQARLAEMAGTTQARVSQIENAEGNPTLETIADVLGALGLDGFSESALGSRVTTTYAAVMDRPLVTEAAIATSFFTGFTVNWDVMNSITQVPEVTLAPDCERAKAA